MGNLSTPKTVQKLQTALHAKAKAEADYRFYALYDKISREDILIHAFAQCRSNKGAPGIHDPVFVPAHRILPIGAIFSGKVPGLDVPGNDQARFGYPTFGPTALVAPIVGMAQGALDAFTETARGAKPMARPGVFEKVAESQLIQSLIGQAAARIDAARTLMLTSLREGQDVVRSGGMLEIEQRVRIRRNHGFAGRTSSEVVNEIYAKSGAAAADEKNRIQRFWRDANTAALHSSIDWDTLSALYGCQQLGLQPQGIF